MAKVSCPNALSTQWRQKYTTVLWHAKTIKEKSTFYKEKSRFTPFKTSLDVAVIH